MTERQNTQRSGDLAVQGYGVADISDNQPAIRSDEIRLKVCA